MADNPSPPMAVPPDQGWQWAFSYLRQDIQDVRAEIREVRKEMRELQVQVRTDIAEIGRRVDRHFVVTTTTLVAIGGVLAALIRL